LAASGVAAQADGERHQTERIDTPSPTEEGVPSREYFLERVKFYEKMRREIVNKLGEVQENLRENIALIEEGSNRAIDERKGQPSEMERALGNALRHVVEARENIARDLEETATSLREDLEKREKDGASAQAERE